MAMKLKIKKGDQVMVITGRDKGKTGEIKRVLRAENRVVVQGVNMAQRHQRQTPSQQGGIISKELPIHVSNVMIVCGACGKATRIGHNVLADGKKVRICRSCNSSLDK